MTEWNIDKLLLFPNKALEELARLQKENHRLKEALSDDSWEADYDRQELEYRRRTEWQ